MRAALLGLLASSLATPAAAADLSTHVLDLARGVGGKGVPVVLARRGADGTWQQTATAVTDAEGRVRSFGPRDRFPTGDYRLTFDLTHYPDAAAKPFFPEIAVTFRVTDASAHYHVPVVVSPYGYSTYRGT